MENRLNDKRQHIREVIAETAEVQQQYAEADKYALERGYVHRATIVSVIETHFNAYDAVESLGHATANSLCS